MLKFLFIGGAMSKVDESKETFPTHGSSSGQIKSNPQQDSQSVPTGGKPKAAVPTDFPKHGKSSGKGESK